MLDKVGIDTGFPPLSNQFFLSHACHIPAKIFSFRVLFHVKKRGCIRCQDKCYLSRISYKLHINVSIQVPIKIIYKKEGRKDMSFHFYE